jgi:hypothetical protein
MLVHFTSVSCQLDLLRGGGSVLSGLWGWFWLDSVCAEVTAVSGLKRGFRDGLRNRCLTWDGQRRAYRLSSQQQRKPVQARADSIRSWGVGFKAIGWLVMMWRMCLTAIDAPARHSRFALLYLNGNMGRLD